MTEAVPFADNLAYLKAELAWLDRVLMRAIAKQRECQREVNRVARTPADRATAHWWQGFINLDPHQGGRRREEVPAALPHPLGRFGDRLAASQAAGVALYLPALTQRLNLSAFERNVVVLGLALESSRRYEKLYDLLNNDGSNRPQPTVDTALRLFCRNEREWLVARTSLLPNAPLLKRKILTTLPGGAGTQLAACLVLQPKWANFLLHGQPSLAKLLPKRSRSKAEVVPLTVAAATDGGSQIVQAG
ncbi:MAG: hypothetical protein HC918_14225 [Oscillatoriales cyanobacterium SM2_1_8]|nr:hypothetical protein [Oscillatoriales cyanobacterium SM2_1_8]